jgi:SAM-dependent methyltransferase
MKKFDKIIHCCPSCNSSNTPNFLKYHHKFNIDYCKCNDCDLVFQNPTYSKESWIQFYVEEYREVYESQKIPSEFVLNRQVQRSLVYENLIKEVVNNNMSSHLDIGSSAGVFLEKIKVAFNIKTSIGIEPGFEYGKLAKQNFQIFKTIDEVLGLGKKFDLITLCHVLEHIPDLRTFLQNTNTILNDNGYLFIEVPNMNSRINSLELAHPICFNFYSIDKLLKSEGFKIVKIWFHGLPSESRTDSKKYMALIAVKENTKLAETTLHRSKLRINEVLWDSTYSTSIFKHYFKFIRFRIEIFIGIRQIRENYD